MPDRVPTGQRPDVEELLNPPPSGLQPEKDLGDLEMPVPSTVKRPSPADIIQPAKESGGLALQSRQLPANRRRFGDSNEIRRLIYDNVLQQAGKIDPIKNARYTLSLHDLEYADPDEFSLKRQKEAILGNKTLYRRLKGTWKLANTVTGDPVDAKRMTIAQVPHMTERGTFIINGTEYTLSHQMRLRPGIFTRIKANGEVEAHVNVMPGKGVSHRYFFEPETSVFKINVGQSRVPLLPVLKAMGVREQDIRKAWGNEIYAINAQHDSPHIVDKLYQRMVRRADPNAPRETKSQALASELNRMELDPEVTKRTLGAPHKNLTAEAILSTTKKLLAVNRRETDADDRDHLAFQNLMGPEDLIAERIGKDKMTLNKLLWQSGFRGNLEHIQPGAFTRSIMNAFTLSGLGQAAEEVNAAELVDHQGRITRLGEGGIGDAQKVPQESRNVHPSQMAFVDPVKTPESFKAGVDLRTAFGVQKGTDGRLYAPFRDPKRNRVVYRSPQELADLTVAFPGELESDKPMVSAMNKGKLRFVPRNQVDLVLPTMENAFSPLSNMVPMKSAVKGQRVSMGARMLSQALPLMNAEAPYVQAAAPIGARGSVSFEQLYGAQMGAVRANKEGTVTSVSNEGIVVRHDDGSKQTYQMYDHHPYNRKTYLHNTPLVKPGQRVIPGAYLAKSNYTDHEGTAALGVNARVGYLPFRGLTYEDATVISESMAKRMTSEQMYQKPIEFGEGVHKGKKAFVSLFPGKYEKTLLDRMDEHGVVKPGTIVKYGEPLALVASEREKAYNQVHRSGKSPFNDNSILWDHQTDGQVTDVVHTRSGALVAVKAYMPMQVGDKLAGRYGDKSVVADIVPDEQMPHGEDGKPFEILVSPMGLISRINSAQAIEAALGKISHKTGRPYKVEDFDPSVNLTQYAMNELKKHGMSDTETVIDPATGRRIPDVLAGHRFFMKLHHTSESKGQGRGAGGGYTAEGTPSKGGEAGSKRVSLMDTNALLAHGATDVLRDAHTVRGQRNEEYWLSFMSGKTPPEPKVPFIYEKFLNELKASGINVVREAKKLNVMPLIDRDIEQLTAGRELQNAETVDWKEGLKPIRGGLFDPGITGGHAGNRWAKITLHEPLPNPVMEEPIRRLLGLTEANFLDILSGKKDLNGVKGPQGITSALKSLDVNKEIARAKAEIASGKKSYRDTAVRRLQYLESAQRMGLHPRDWIVNSVPVLPPTFRPVSLMQGKRGQLISDPNYLYREVWDANQNLKELKGRVDDVSEERLNLYNAFKGVTGLGDPIQPKNVEKGVKGILRHVFGTNPKFSTVQFKLLGASVNLVGRGVIVPNPDMDMDSIGLPEHRVWEVYKPFIIRGLVRSGMPGMAALQAVQDKTKAAKDVMLKVMQERPVLVNRYPVLHRYGLMAFWPKLVHGETIQVSPIITKGFGADFDGDTMQYHVPASEDSRKDSIAKMLPSANLFAGATFKVNYTPNQEFIQGLHAASHMKDEDTRPKRTFATRKDALNAYRRGEINLGTPIEILG